VEKHEKKRKYYCLKRAVNDKLIGKGIIKQRKKGNWIICGGNEGMREVGGELFFENEIEILKDYQKRIISYVQPSKQEI